MSQAPAGGRLASAGKFIDWLSEGVWSDMLLFFHSGNVGLAGTVSMMPL